MKYKYEFGDKVAYIKMGKLSFGTVVKHIPYISSFGLHNFISDTYIIHCDDGTEYKAWWSDLIPSPMARIQQHIDSYKIYRAYDDSEAMYNEGRLSEANEILSILKDGDNYV